MFALWLSLYRNSTDFHTKQSVNFVPPQKIGSRSRNFCICIFASIDQSAFSASLNISWDTSQTKILDLTSTIWRIKAQINYEKIFSFLKGFKIHFLTNLIHDQSAGAIEHTDFEESWRIYMFASVCLRTLSLLNCKYYFIFKL